MYCVLWIQFRGLYKSKKRQDISIIVNLTFIRNWILSCFSSPLSSYDRLLHKNIVPNYSFIILYANLLDAREKLHRSSFSSRRYESGKIKWKNWKRQCTSHSTVPAFVNNSANIKRILFTHKTREWINNLLAPEQLPPDSYRIIKLKIRLSSYLITAQWSGEGE